MAAGRWARKGGIAETGREYTDEAARTKLRLKKGKNIPLEEGRAADARRTS